MPGGSRSSAERGAAGAKAAPRVAIEVFTTREMSRLVGLSAGCIRRCVYAGFLHPARGHRRRFEFALRDLRLLRSARSLLASGLGPGRVAGVVQALQQQVGPRDVSSVKLSLIEGRILANDGKRTWQPDSGQLLLGFARRTSRASVRRLDGEPTADDALNAYDAFSRGLSLERRAPEEAKAAYLEALRIDPSAVPALVNLGRLEHQSGHWDAAERCYREVLALEPTERTAAFNLALLAESRGDTRLAVRRYEQALLAAPDLADAHHRLARLHAALGDQAAARRHSRLYRTLLRRGAPTPPAPRAR